MAELGWATLVEAKAYFADERLETTEWDDALITDDKKNLSLNTAYNRIYYSPTFAVPAAGAEAPGEQHNILVKAQCEMAYYLLVHLADEDSRKGLQAQGVVDAGIVKERYDKDMLNKLPIPPIVEELLEDFATDVSMVMLPIDRDENEDLNTDVVEED